METTRGGQGPELTGNVLFYRKPEPLSLEAHGKLGVKRIDQPFAFLRDAHAVPLTVSEFGLAAGSFPVIFVGSDKTPVAVMGVRQGQNLFVDADGKSKEDCYIPAFARRYPFVFAQDDSQDRLLLCVDREAQMISDTPEVPFFEGDQPSKFTQDAIEFCKEFERQRRATAEFVKMIDSYGLFEEKSVNFTPRDAQGNDGPVQKVADYWAISEEKLNQLPTDKFIELRDNGLLGACYAHMVSLLNWNQIINRALRTPPPVSGNA